jgi:hypothetical protein
MEDIIEKGQNCIYSFFDKWFFNEYRCFRFGDDCPLQCEGCLHYITDDMIEGDTKRIKCDMKEVNV